MSVRLSGPPDHARGSRVDARMLRTRAQQVLRAVGQAGAELSLSLVDDDEMADINRAYRGIDRPTDVLSFSLLDGEGAEHRGHLLGDVVIGIETAARQARERHRGLDQEIARLLIHGVLHLVGHDHEESEEAKAMRAEERRLWSCLRGRS
jgi:probable rRNA maturation factor